MSKELNNMSKTVMDKINHDKIKMHPKAYFVAGSALALMGLTASIIVSVFLIALLKFSLRTHGPMGGYRLDQILSSFPWWALIVAILGLVSGIWIIRRYDFSYKINFAAMVFGFIVAIIIGGLIMDATGLNDALFQRGPGQGVMRRYLQQRNSQNN
jgi:hypothetical protein